MNESLSHYGVKGMKWGVRKQPKFHKGVRENTKGDLVIAKGTTFHRLASADPANERKIGYAYASFIKRDNDHYRTEMSLVNDNADRDSFDLTMKATKDLVLPSSKVKVNTFLDSMKDTKIQNLLEKVYVDIISSDDHTMGRFNTIANNIHKNTKLSKNASQWYAAHAIAMNYSPKVRDDFIKRLSKKGYDGMLDTEDLMVMEAQAPVIVFRRENSLKIVTSKTLGRNYWFTPEAEVIEKRTDAYRRKHKGNSYGSFNRSYRKF